VAELERSEEMNHTLIAVLSTVVLVLAAPSFAARDEQSGQPNPASSAQSSIGGAPVSPVIEQGRVLAGDMVATGDVMMSDPGELVIHTSSGMRRFEITPATQMYAGTAEGDVVTVFYKPEAGSARVVSVKRVSVSKRSHVQPTKLVRPVAKTTDPMSMGR
jgi:hypothetical protein